MDHTKAIARLVVSRRRHLAINAAPVSAQDVGHGGFTFAKDRLQTLPKAKRKMSAMALHSANNKKSLKRGKNNWLRCHGFCPAKTQGSELIAIA